MTEATYGICRIQKIKDWGSLGASEEHTARQRETPNADPSVSVIRLMGEKDDPDLATLVRERIGSQKIRSNAVLAVEFILSASPEYFCSSVPASAGACDFQRLDEWAIASTNWLWEKYGDNIVRAELHLDESTPHVHAYLVPLDEKGKLNARAFFNGRKKLSDLQDSYAEAVRHLGLERGVKGSTATYTKVRQYYRAVNTDSLPVELVQLPQPQPQETAASYRERATQILQPVLLTVNHQLTDRQWARKQKRDAERKALASERERQKLEQRIEELEAEVANWKARVRRLGDLALEDVAYELGFDPLEKGIGRWKRGEDVINVEGSKFFNFTRNCGGGGTIDLVMLFEECNFSEALAWLRDRFGESGAMGAATHYVRNQTHQILQEVPPRSFVPPDRDDSQWVKVQNYLTVKRKLPSNLVDALHQQGLVYAGGNARAVFLHRSLDREIVGATFYPAVEGFGDVRLASGTFRSAGWFWIGAGGKPNDSIQKVAIASNPIDALSLRTLHPPPGKTLYLAADYQNLPLDFLHSVPEVVVAYGNDPALIEQSRAVKKLLPHATRLRPKAQDWNLELTKSLQGQLKQPDDRAMGS